MTHPHPIPHYLSPVQHVLEIDFAEGCVLVGILGKHHEPTSVYKRERLTYEKGGWRHAAPRPGADFAPPLHAEPGTWRKLSHTHPLTTERIYYEKRHVKVPRTDFARALTSMHKVVGKSLGDDSLLTVEVRADGVRLRSHGATQLSASFDFDGARDGLGQVVVFLGALRDAVKEASADDLRIAVKGSRLTVGRSSVWTVNEAPCSAPAATLLPVDVGLSPAICRALPFASTDPSRSNLTSVALTGKKDHVVVAATDGHKLYLERVEAAAAVEALDSRQYLLPRAALQALRIGKRAGSYRLAFDGHETAVACGDKEIRCTTASTFPPIAQLLVDADDPPPGWATVDVPVERVGAMVAWLREQDSVAIGAARVHFNEAGSVRLVVTVPNTPEYNAEDGEEEIEAEETQADEEGETTTERPSTIARAQVFGECEDFTEALTRGPDLTPFNIDRGFAIDLLASALDVFDEGPVRFAFSYNPLDLLQVVAGPRTVSIAPMRLQAAQ